jgi:hypothetical protein
MFMAAFPSRKTRVWAHPTGTVAIPLAQHYGEIKRFFLLRPSTDRLEVEADIEDGCGMRQRPDGD